MPVPPIELLPWDDGGFDLLEALNTPAQKLYLGGPETAANLRQRHARYLTYHRPGDTEMLRISVDGAIVGSIGYWQIERLGQPDYETGWEILPDHHGRGIGSAAAAMLMARLQSVARHRFVYATPTPDNPGSNGICRKLGFVLLGVEDVEYPPGTVSPHNIWRLDLWHYAPQTA